ncbi:respiratory chain complex I subunit 1 family protein [Helicovermis profundi]|uniref:Respiratory chain complex I subunit 1 family protein n=1 Tax=Helicovermis profundi TaxID=3065157 RepID=A0AAU9E740_9FIRM|nr:respiratory chain complex I subunit 1 family protein [Clostridia bacterium S502]
MSYNIFLAVSSIILIFLAPLFSGVLKKIKAFLRGYQGLSIFQVYYDIYKLFNKDTLRSSKSSFITIIAPIVSLSAAITSAFMIPIFYTNSSNILGNMIIIIFLLGIIKFFNTLLGLDSSSTFGGMGSSRELFLSMLVEPVVFLVIMFLYFQKGTFNIFQISNSSINENMFTTSNILAFVAFFIVVLVENARLPVDNPETHLELTMIHEAMVLDVSGKDLAYIELASMIKFSVLLTMLINIFIPFGLTNIISIASLCISIGMYLVKVIIVISIISFIEILIAKSRLFRAPDLIAVSFSLIIAAISLSYFI